MISIHALVKRATSEVDYAPTSISEFQSTPSWRGRLSGDIMGGFESFDFNPRPREEGDQMQHLMM